MKLLEWDQTHSNAIALTCHGFRVEGTCFLVFLKPWLTHSSWNTMDSHARVRALACVSSLKMSWTNPSTTKRNYASMTEACGAWQLLCAGAVLSTMLVLCLPQTLLSHPCWSWHGACCTSRRISRPEVRMTLQQDHQAERQQQGSERVLLRVVSDPTIHGKGWGVHHGERGNRDVQRERGGCSSWWHKFQGQGERAV